MNSVRFSCFREEDECRKLGEGTYGEVFLLHSEDESVLKVIPVEGSVIINGENQKTFLEIFSEMIISKYDICCFHTDRQHFKNTFRCNLVCVY